MTERWQAESTPDLRGVVAVIARARRDVIDPEDVPSPADENEAASLLCPRGCDRRAPLVSEFASSRDYVDAHLVVPHEGGYFVVPALDFGNGPYTRCPDKITGEVHRDGGLILARITKLENSLVECGPRADPACMSGCLWAQRTDREIVISSRTGRLLEVEGWRHLGGAVEAGTTTLPEGSVQREGTVVSAHGCGAQALIELEPPRPTGR